MHFPAENILYNALSQDKQSVSSVPEHVRLKNNYIKNINNSHVG